MPIRKITITFFADILLLFNGFTYSQNNINILTWSHIFDSSPILLKKLKNIKEKCDLNINFDHYSNHGDFLEQLSGHDYDYDIVVAPNTFLNLISKYIPKTPNPQLENITKKYNPYVKKHFDNAALPPNTIYFLISALYDRYTEVNNNKVCDFLKRISPVAWVNINLNGHYEFSEKSPEIDFTKMIENLDGCFDDYIE